MIYLHLATEEEKKKILHLEERAKRLMNTVAKKMFYVGEDTNENRQIVEDSDFETLFLNYSPAFPDTHKNDSSATWLWGVDKKLFDRLLNVRIELRKFQHILNEREYRRLLNGE